MLNSYGTPGHYRALYYDSINSRIVAAGCLNDAVQFFDLNLDLKYSTNVQSCPHGICVYNSKIYVSVWHTGNVVVIKNDGLVESVHETVCLTQFSRISVDSFGYFALSCARDGHVYLYDSSMQYTNESIGFSENGLIWDARLDTNDRLAICVGLNVYIYN